jgi:AcrR family transcriptional regulator
MARRPAGSPERRPRRPISSEPTPTGGETRSRRDTIIDALLALLTEHPIEEIKLSEVARRADVTLAELREEFGSELAILAAHMKDVDREVLEGIDPDMAEEPARERLFDVLMRRLEVLATHKEAIRSLMRSARRDPPLALALNSLAVRSQQWMLTAADISASGPVGALRAQGLAISWASVIRTWLDDDDPGLARTMAVLDRELARGQRLSGFLDDMCRFGARFRGPRRRGRTRRGYDRPDGDAITA